MGLDIFGKKWKFRKFRELWRILEDYELKFSNEGGKLWHREGYMIFLRKSFLASLMKGVGWTQWFRTFSSKKGLFSCPGRMFSYCVRARAYTHVLARVYSTRASTCTIYTCFTLPPTRVNPTGLQLSIFQNFGLLWPILEHLCCQTNFMVGLNRIETTLTLTLTTVEAISENLGRVWFVYNSYICKRITLCRPLLTSSVNSAENEIPDAP